MQVGTPVSCLYGPKNYAQGVIVSIAGEGPDAQARVMVTKVTDPNGRVVSTTHHEKNVVLRYCTAR